MKIIVANWKMNNAFDEADAWLDAFLKGFALNQDQLMDQEIILCPPVFIIDYLDSELMEDSFQNLEVELQREQKKIDDFTPEEITEIVMNDRPVKLGAQDCHYEKSGSFTGDVAAEMLHKIGCAYVILGHSERRANHFETDQIIAKKVQAALTAELTPIICVGESKEIRDQKKHLEFVYKQLKNSVPQDVKFKKLIIAYEPIWSIGTGVTPTIEQIAEMAKLIKQVFREKFAGIADEYFMLYGGSVTSQNSKEILAVANVDGVLVGKASLDANEFIKICNPL